MNMLPMYSVVKRDSKYYLYDIQNNEFYTVPYATVFGTVPVKYSTESVEEAREMAAKVSYEFVS